jgi:four helix bundle protein
LATIKCFEDLEIWQAARELSVSIIEISNRTELKNDFRLRDQIKNSSSSIMDNSAEGFERDGNMEFRQFLSIEKGSSGETRSQLYRLYDNGYIDNEELLELTEACETLSKRIANFIGYLNKKNFKGNKFREGLSET